MHSIFGYISGLLILVGFYPYISDILHKRVKPQRISWLLWSTLGLVVFFTQLSLGATYSLILPGVDTLGVSIIFLLSLKTGRGGLSLMEGIALVVALLSFLVWYITHSPSIALYMAIIIDGTGTTLTLKKTYTEPKSETYFIWVTSTLAGIATVLAVSKPTFNLLVYPVYYTVECGSVVMSKYFGDKAKI